MSKKVAVFGAKPYDEESFKHENELRGQPLSFSFFKDPLEPRTATLAKGHLAVVGFVNDVIDRKCLNELADLKVHCLAMRCSGYNNIDLEAAKDLGFRIATVPQYSPHAVAEHVLALLLTLNRKTHRAYNRVREGNFSLEGLLGFDLFGKTIGVIGTGAIGSVVATIFCGFGCRVIAHDKQHQIALKECGVSYESLESVLTKSDIVTLHCPLTPETYHLINERTLALMKPGAHLINTSRGGLVDTKAVIGALKLGHLGALALDVYEEEEGVFFEDLSSQIIQDDVLQLLTTYPNVLITAHQAYFTKEALQQIAMTTVDNLLGFVEEKKGRFEISL